MEFGLALVEFTIGFFVDIVGGFLFEFLFGLFGFEA